MQHWQIFLGITITVFFIALYEIRKRHSEHNPQSPYEIEAQKQYEEDMATLAELKAKLAASPTGVLQTQIAALEAKLGLNTPSN